MDNFPKTLRLEQRTETKGISITGLKRSLIEVGLKLRTYVRNELLNRN